MKNKTLLLLLCAGLLSTTAMAQHAIKWTPTSYLFTRTVTFTYEHALTPKRSLNTGVNLWLWNVNASTANSGEGDASLFLLGVAPELRYYLGARSEVPRGFFAAPYLNLNFGKVTAESTNDAGETGSGSASASIIAGGGIIGYQFLISDVFVIDLFGGINYTNINIGKIEINYPDGTSDDAQLNLNIGGLLPRFGLSLGFAF